MTLSFFLLRLVHSNVDMYLFKRFMNIYIYKQGNFTSRGANDVTMKKHRQIMIGWPIIPMLIL